MLGCAAVTAVNHVHDTGWVSYRTVEGARGGGVAAAGVRALARWAFDDLGLHRLELGHRTNNPASCKVAERAGFAVEGLERGSSATATSGTTWSGTPGRPPILSILVDASWLSM